MHPCRLSKGRQICCRVDRIRDDKGAADVSTHDQFMQLTEDVRQGEGWYQDGEPKAARRRPKKVKGPLQLANAKNR